MAALGAPTIHVGTRGERAWGHPTVCWWGVRLRHLGYRGPLPWWAMRWCAAQEGDATCRCGMYRLSWPPGGPGRL